MEPDNLCPPTGARFYNKLESWWNRPSRLQQAAQDLIHEDPRLRAEEATADNKDIWEWLEDRARRTSILHRMLRRVDETAQNQSCSVQHTLGFANALSAKLAKEYLATLVKVMLYLSPRTEGDIDVTRNSPFRIEEEENRVLEEILAVCARQSFENLRNAQSGRTTLENATGQLPNNSQIEETPEIRQAQPLTSEVESLLYALLDGFAEPKLAEIHAESDSDTGSFDETVEEAYENLPPELKKSEIRPLSHSQPDLDDLFGIDAKGDDFNPTAATFLSRLFSRIESDLVDSYSPRSERGVRRACMLLDTLENLRIRLVGLYDTLAAKNAAGAEHGHNDDGRNDSLYCVLRLDCAESVSWTTFNACLAKTTLALAIYSHQQRRKGGNIPRRNRLRSDERDTSSIAPQSPGFNRKAGEVIYVSEPDIERTLGMTTVEKAYAELLDSAVTCAASTEWTPRIHDILRLLVELWDRYVEHQTSLWMELPAPKLRVTDFVDDTEVARAMRRLIVIVMFQHRITVGECPDAANGTLIESH